MKFYKVLRKASLTLYPCGSRIVVLELSMKLFYNRKLSIFSFCSKFKINGIIITVNPQSFYYCGKNCLWLQKKFFLQHSSLNQAVTRHYSRSLNVMCQVSSELLSLYKKVNPKKLHIE